MIGLLADDEQSDAVVCLDVIKIIDVRSNEFEDEHNVVPLVQVNLLVLFNRLRNLLFLLIFLYVLIHVNFLGRFNNLFAAFLFLHLLSLSVDVLFLYLDVLVVKLLVFFDFYF